MSSAQELDPKIVMWNSWAKRFNAMLDKGFEETTFPAFLEAAVRKMYRNGWKAEDAGKAFIWAMYQIEHYRPVGISVMGGRTPARC